MCAQPCIAIRFSNYILHGDNFVYCAVFLERVKDDFNQHYGQNPVADEDMGMMPYLKIGLALYTIFVREVGGENCFITFLQIIWHLVFYNFHNIFRIIY